jgi:hypothetical protein
MLSRYGKYLNTACHNAEYFHTACQYADYHNTACHYVECLHTACHSAKCHAEPPNTACLYVHVIISVAVACILVLTVYITECP